MGHVPLSQGHTGTPRARLFLLWTCRECKGHGCCGRALHTLEVEAGPRSAGCRMTQPLSPSWAQPHSRAHRAGALRSGGVGPCHVDVS